VKLDPNRPMIPPDPHYPYFRYLCPTCEKFWEREISAEDFVLECSSCRERKARWPMKAVYDGLSDEEKKDIFQRWTRDSSNYPPY